MKKIILIILVLFSCSLYSNKHYNSNINNKEKRSNLELGATIGFFTSSGFSIRYHLTDDFSMKLSGFLINASGDNGNLYEARASLLYTIHNKKSSEIYIIGSGFKTRLMPLWQSSASNNDNIDIQGFALGIGLKFKLTKVLSFLIEVQENRVTINNKKTEFRANINFGLLFDL